MLRRGVRSLAAGRGKCLNLIFVMKAVKKSVPLVIGSAVSIWKWPDAEIRLLRPVRGQEVLNHLLATAKWRPIASAGLSIDSSVVCGGVDTRLDIVRCPHAHTGRLEGTPCAQSCPPTRLPGASHRLGGGAAFDSFVDSRHFKTCLKVCCTQAHPAAT